MRLSQALGEVPGVRVVPAPPQTPLFHVHLEGERDVLWQRMLEIAEANRVWLANRLAPTSLPGVSRLELHLGEPALEIAPAEAAWLLAAVVA